MLQPEQMEETIDSCWRAPEDVLAIYGALSTYLKVLAQQPEEDLAMIARVTRLMINIKPQAVEASREIAGRKK